MNPLRCLSKGSIAVLSRRKALQGALMVGANALISTIAFPKIANAFDLKDKDSEMKIDALLAALRATQKKVCLTEADRLETSTQSTYDFRLHMRNTGLDVQDALQIAKTMKGLSEAVEYSMRSFSISYNPGVQDAGAIAFISSFPNSLIEVGMVDCGLKDESGNFLLKWAHQNRQLRMICIEGNNFSPELKEKFSALRKNRNNLLVIV